VALKWTDIDDHFIHIERSRVRNKEKDDLKTEESRRAIEIRPAMRKVLDAQFELTRAVKKPVRVHQHRGASDPSGQTS
jgi:hypothetical protein